MPSLIHRSNCLYKTDTMTKDRMDSEFLYMMVSMTRRLIDMGVDLSKMESIVFSIKEQHLDYQYQAEVEYTE